MADVNLEFVSTEDLINEVRRRCGVFFCIASPLVEAEEYDWRMHWGTDGAGPSGKHAVVRVLGLIEIGKHQLLSSEREGEG